MLDALSPMSCHVLAKVQIWHLGELQSEGFLEAKSLVYMVLPALCLNSMGSMLSPVRNVAIRELAEKAPRWLLFQAKTQGWESV